MDVEKLEMAKSLKRRIDEISRKLGNLNERDLLYITFRTAPSVDVTLDLTIDEGHTVTKILVAIFKAHLAETLAKLEKEFAEL